MAQSTEMLIFLFKELTNIFSLSSCEAFNHSSYMYYIMTELTVPLPVIRRLGRELLSAISQFLYTSYMEEFTMGCHKNSWKQTNLWEVWIASTAITQDLNFTYTFIWYMYKLLILQEKNCKNYDTWYLKKMKISDFFFYFPFLKKYFVIKI